MRETLLGGWEENLPYSTDLKGLTSTGEPRTAVVAYEDAKLKSQWITWIHEYVHGFQNPFFETHTSDISYFMHPNCQDRYADIDSRDILESNRR